mmetsp:Transcript_25367/g.78092  ORF Transcript_25367/g.78092 Transcript_25367/m.78092 type:complete len:202 (+) Transcript_25367:568-1173(+)
MTSPSDMASTAAFTASVALQAGAHLMSLLISSVIHFAAGISENFSLDPFFGRPKCEQTVTLAPLLQRYSIVGMEAVMRVTSVISRSAFRGTLRSQRMSTFLPFKSDSLRSSTDFFACKLVGARLDEATRCPQNAAATSSSAATPGNTLPSKSSKLAPPPVEMCDILSARPDLFTAATESPPPMMVTAPFFSVSSARHSAMS